jgi:prevent-host-death family protein
MTSEIGSLRRITASDAKARLLQILDDIERGEAVIITRHGRAIARLVPEADTRRAEIEQAVKTIKELQRRTGRIKIEELLSSRHEGHKY